MNKGTIIFMLPSISAGGAERVVSILSAELAKKGNRVILALFDDAKMAYQISQRVEIVRVGPRRRKPDFFRKVIILAKLKYLFLKNPNAIIVPFQYSCLKYAMEAKKGTTVKVVACERNDPYHQNVGNELEAKQLFHQADFSVFQTDDARKYYFSDSKSNSKVIVNPLSGNYVEWKGQVNLKRVITVCRLTKQKNLFMAIDAMKLLRDRMGDSVYLDIFGSGELKDELVKYAEQKNIASNVHFMGTTQTIQEELSSSSVFILTSDYEGMSNAMLEALAVGIPVICTDCPIGGARQVINSGYNGILVGIGESKLMADEIEKVLCNEEYAKMLGINGKKIRESLSITNVVGEWENVFDMIWKES